MSQCKVYLENYSGTYYAGSEIKGRVECYFDDKTTVRGVKIRIKCKEYNSWSGTESYTDPVDNKTKTRHITLVGDRNVLTVAQTLFGSDSGSRELSRGRHVYPFSYHLPHDIPSTFHGPHGSITYKVKAIVDRPMRTDYEDDFLFVVVSPIDFNRMSKDLQDISTYSDEKSVCCWCCKGGDISLEVELPRIAFVAGETIPFKVHVLNMSNSNVENLKVKFKKTVHYKVTSPHSESKEDVSNIVEFNEHGVGAHGEHTYNLELVIPNHVEVPNFKKCELFKVDYAMNVEAEMGGCTWDLDVDVWDIQMGHVKYVDAAVGVANNKSPSPQPGITAPPAEGAYPPPGPFPTGGMYPPPQNNVYPPGPMYPPPASGGYPPAFPPPAGGGYPPAGGPGYPPATNGNYPGPSLTGYPPSPSYPGVSVPGAPFVPNMPAGDHSKAREAASSTPSAPPTDGSELPPPSYDQLQQNSGFAYPPK